MNLVQKLRSSNWLVDLNPSGEFHEDPTDIRVPLTPDLAAKLSGVVEKVAATLQWVRGELYKTKAARFHPSILAYLCVIQDKEIQIKECISAIKKGITNTIGFESFRWVREFERYTKEIESKELALSMEKSPAVKALPTQAEKNRCRIGGVRSATRLPYQLL